MILQAKHICCHFFPNNLSLWLKTKNWFCVCYKIHNYSKSVLPIPFKFDWNMKVNYPNYCKIGSKFILKEILATKNKIYIHSH